MGGGGGGFGAAVGGIAFADAELNDLADQLQLLDVVTRDVIRRADEQSGATPGSRGDQSVSVTYRLPARTSLPSRADHQLVQIARVDAPATFVKVATPQLTQYVYDEATLINRSDLVLLAGPAASYAGGEFVGRGTVPTVAAGESFSAGFGIDTALRASRELVERTESIQGGNRVVDVTYRLALENFGRAPVPIRLFDRIPDATGSEIKVTLTNSGGATHPLSEDPNYLRTQRRRGILRWELVVPASVSGTDAFSFEYAYRLEYDRQMTVTGGRE